MESESPRPWQSFMSETIGLDAWAQAVLEACAYDGSLERNQDCHVATDTILRMKRLAVDTSTSDGERPLEAAIELLAKQYSAAKPASLLVEQAAAQIENKHDAFRARLLALNAALRCIEVHQERGAEPAVISSEVSLGI